VPAHDFRGQYNDDASFALILPDMAPHAPEGTILIVQ